MTRDTRSRLAIRIDALQRLFMWHFLSGKVPLYLVTEYPKCGGSWFAQMLATYLEVPFVRNQRPRLLFLEPCVLHGHHLYSPTFQNVFCVIRDGRDVMVSAYFHTLFHNDKNPPWAVEERRNEVPFNNYENVEKNLPLFIEFMFTEHSQGLFHFRWDEFVSSWINEDAPVVKYEDMLEDAASALYGALEKVTGETPDIERLREIEHQFSFENIAGRKRGQEDTKTFLRKGVAGDWKNRFTQEACEVFDRFAGETLIQLGYEENREWIKDWV